MFGDGHGNAGDIDLLETVTSEKGNRHICCDRNDRNRIHIGSGDTSDQIGCTGTGGRHADAHFSGSSGITVCRMRSSLFMGGQDMMDFLVMFIKFIINIQDRTARIPKNGIHTLFFQAFHNDLRTC